MKTMKFISVFAFLAMFVCFINAQNVNKINETSFFKVKFTKNKAWNVQRFPAYPISGQDWTLTGLKGVVDASSVNVDWGYGRYLKFVAETDNTRSAYSLVDDVDRTPTKYNVSLKLFESNGTLVKVISRWGNLIGMGDKGFLYEIEGFYGAFFSVTDLQPTSQINYRPSVAKVNKLSEIVNAKDMSKRSEPSQIVQNNTSTYKRELSQNNAPRARTEIEQNNTSRTNTVVTQNIAVKPKEVTKTLNSSKPNTTFDIFKAKYKIDQVWEVESVESTDDAKVTYKIIGPAIYEHGGGDISINNWGKNNDRYMMVSIQEGSSEYFSSSVEMFETTGERAGRGGYGYNSGRISDLGSLGFVFWNHTPNSDIRLFFSKTPLKATDIITYIPTKKEVTKLSDI